MSKEPDNNLLDDDNSDSCAVCGKRQFSAANLSRQVFQVNTANNCGHKFCSSCIDRELSRKRQFSCPQCTSMVSREKVWRIYNSRQKITFINKYSNQQLSNRSVDETEVERDFRIRKGIKAIYNKTEADFSSLDSFKDYEEVVEDLIFSKVNIINVEETNAAIERYKQNNSDIITINQMRRNEDIKKEFSAIKEEEDLKRLHDAQFHVCSNFYILYFVHLLDH
jgi:CDK-activating kinase assembly factor MAT1